MAGIRIHHPSLRSCVLLIPHPGDANTGRNPKDYHIHLDEEGDSIVSTTVWMRLRQARDSGLSPHEFIVLNEVVNPPMIMMDENTAPRKVVVYRQHSDGVSDTELLAVAQRFAPKGIAPRITRKES